MIDRAKSAIARLAAPLPRLAASAALFGVLGAGAGYAQTGDGGQVELGTFGTYASYDDLSLGLAGGFGAGARLAVFLNPMLSLEANGDFIQTDSLGSLTEVNVTRIGGTLFGHLKAADWSTFYLGAGYERMFYRGGMAGDDNGAHVILGDRISLGSRVALRLEGRAAYYPNSPFQAAGDQVINLAGALGVSIYSFGAPTRDSDGDRVADSRDLCPRTPAGANVDATGCPSDVDGDRVLAGLDACPDTPRGATVDALGCPADSDGDLVLDGIDRCPDTPAGAEVGVTGCPLDADGDGVFDGRDACPDTPAGAGVDERGCPLDGDGDGVFDGLDACADTPEGATIDERGCPTDADGDGVADSADRCPDTPAGAAVDASGCPPGDKDKDGVPNDADRCPNTAPQQRVDEVGCPVLFVVEEGERRPLVLTGVTFASSRSRLNRTSYAVLNEVAASLLAHPSIRVEIAGHTDATGSDRLNVRLSRARAQSVKAYLVRMGVDPSRMVAEGYGSAEPVASNRTKSGRAQNRRVELRVIPE